MATAQARWQHSRLGALSEALPHLPNGELLLALAFLGLAGGGLEAAVAAIGYRIFHRVGDSWMAGEMLWLTPIATALTLVALGVVLLMLQRLLRVGTAWNGAILFLLSALAAWSVVQAARIGVSPVAQVILVAGVATAVTRVARWRPAGFRRSMRVGTGAIMALLLVWSLLGLAADPAASGRTPHPDVAVTAARPLNVVLLVWDTARARSLSLYGHSRETTPNLDRFAERAVVFDAAVTTAPWTLPAHASMFTGLYPFEHRADRGVPLDDTPRTLAEALADHGYRTAGFVANRFWAGRATGLDRGFDRYQDRGRARRVAMPYLRALSKPLLRELNRVLSPGDNPDRVSAQMIHGAFLDWADRQDARPFFAFLNLFDVHDPYQPPESFGFHFGVPAPRTTWDTPEAAAFTADDVQQLRDAYDSCVYYLDHQFGVLLQQLEARGLLDNTVVIVTSDHGETLGEHRPELFGHASNIFADVLKVPLVVYAPPGLLANGRRAAPVSLVDLPATILDLVGAREVVAFPGTSLLPILLTASGAAEVGRPAWMLSQLNPPAGYPSFPGWPESKGTLQSLLGVQWHYMVDAEGREQLFDIQADPREAKDLSQAAGSAAVLAQMRAELRRQVR